MTTKVSNVLFFLFFFLIVKVKHTSAVGAGVGGGTVVGGAGVGGNSHSNLTASVLVE